MLACFQTRAIASPENPRILTCDAVLPNERYEHGSIQVFRLGAGAMLG